MEFTKARKRLNRELKWVARGDSPARAMDYLRQMFSMVLTECGKCGDGVEIMRQTAKMISLCAAWQGSAVSAISTACAPAEETRQHCNAETEEQENE